MIMHINPNTKFCLSQTKSSQAVMISINREAELDVFENDGELYIAVRIIEKRVNPVRNFKGVPRPKL